MGTPRRVVRRTKVLLKPGKVVVKQLKSTPRRVCVRSTALLRTDPVGVKTGLVSLLLATVAGLIAGIVLGSITDTLIALPGLVVLAPASIGLRGNVFGALASRLSTMAQLGELRFLKNFKNPVGQNLYASIVLSMGTSLLLAGVAKIVSESFGVENAITFSEFFVIAIIGSIIPTIVLLGVTVFLAKLSVKKGWDLDNVGAPIITATGDMVTIPSLVLATVFIGHGWVTNIASFVTFVAAIVILATALFSTRKILKRIVRESLPMLVAMGTISILAGVTIQGQIESLALVPILVVLIPPLLSTNGAIGAVLSARVATKLHLGIVKPKKFSMTAISEDVTVSYLLAIPVFLILGLSSFAIEQFSSLDGPGFIKIMAITFIAGIVATTFSNIVGYFTATLSHGLGLDPDNFAVPSVTSISDLIGTVVLIVTIGAFGI